jgi:hypothetical protein
LNKFEMPDQQRNKLRSKHVLHVSHWKWVESIGTRSSVGYRRWCSGTDCALHCLWPFVWFLHFLLSQGIISILDKGNTKRVVSPRLKIRPCDLDFWPWKSIRFQILLRSKYVPSLVKIHWRMLILECSQGCYAVKIWPCDIDAVNI